MRAEALYRAADARDLNRIRLDSLTAVFDRRSGQTHLLAEPLPELLDALGTDQWSLADFAAQLATDFDLNSDDGDAAMAIAARLDELVALGLVERR